VTQELDEGYEEDNDDEVDDADDARSIF
jgi:hypothetical protein